MGTEIHKRKEKPKTQPHGENAVEIQRCTETRAMRGNQRGPEMGTENKKGQ